MPYYSNEEGIKLALKLREADFPFTAYENIPNWHEDYSSISFNGKTLKVPILSELIEACGENFESLSIWATWETPAGIRKFIDRNNHWRAYGCLYGRWSHSFEGSTPEEAVANLWLALKKSKEDSSYNPNK